MATPFYSDDYATLALDENIPCIRLVLNGVPRHSEHYATIQAKRLELMRNEIGNFPRLHMLTDSRNAGPVLDEDVAHFKSVIMPAMEQSGIRYLAIVMPAGKFTRLTIQEMTEETKVMTVRYFDLLSDAESWLMQMKGK